MSIPNSEKIEAEVDVWINIIKNIPTGRSHLKDELLKILENPLADISHRHRKFREKREILISDNHHQGWFWEERFTGIKKLIGTFFPKIFGQWLFSFFQGSQLRRALANEPKDQIKKTVKVIKTEKENKRNRLTKVFATEKNLIEEGYKSQLELLENDKEEIGFACYVKLITNFAKQNPLFFIKFYKNKIRYVGDDAWDHVIHHCWGNAVIQHFVSHETVFHETVFHEGILLLLLFTQPYEKKTSAMEILLNDPNSFDTSHQTKYHEALKNFIVPKIKEINPYKLARSTPTSIADEPLDSPLALLKGFLEFSPVNPVNKEKNKKGFLEFSPVNKEKNKLVAECLSRMLIELFVILGMCTSNKANVEETVVKPLDEISMAPGGRIYNSILSVADYGLPHYKHVHDTSWTKGGVSLLSRLDPLSTHHQTIASSLNHSENIFNLIVQIWLTYLDAIDSEAIITKQCRELPELTRSLTHEENIWLMYRLNEFHEKHLKSNPINAKILKAIENIIQEKSVRSSCASDEGGLTKNDLSETTVKSVLLSDEGISKLPKTATLSDSFENSPDADRSSGVAKKTGDFFTKKDSASGTTKSHTPAPF